MSFSFESITPGRAFAKMSLSTPRDSSPSKRRSEFTPRTGGASRRFEDYLPIRERSKMCCPFDANCKWEDTSAEALVSHLQDDHEFPVVDANSFDIEIHMFTAHEKTKRIGLIMTAHGRSFLWLVESIRHGDRVSIGPVIYAIPRAGDQRIFSAEMKAKSTATGIRSLVWSGGVVQSTSWTKTLDHQKDMESGCGLRIEWPTDDFVFRRKDENTQSVVFRTVIKVDG